MEGKGEKGRKAKMGACEDSCAYLFFNNTGALVHSRVGVFASESDSFEQRDHSGKQETNGGMEGKEK